MGFKIVIINEAFQMEYFSRRWKLFAEEHPDVDVTLLMPAESSWFEKKKYSFGESFVLKGREEDKGNFHTRSFRTTFSKTWLSKDFKPLLLTIRPDIIYHIGYQWQPSLCQVGRIAKKWLPRTKLILFSMRGPAMDIANQHGIVKLLAKVVVGYINKNYDAVFCHYPTAVECFRKEGYKGPIYMQTQVGVNTEWFFKNANARNEIRAKFNISDSTFVFGSAARFTLDKGIDDVIRALPTSGNWVYLLMGSGSAEEIGRLKSLINERQLSTKVILTGFVDRLEMAKYWNAVDCAIHVPRTTKDWVETFSLSAIQPQAVGVPIIGNDSGSMPYQVGFEDMIVPEGDITALSQKIQWMMDNKEETILIGQKMFKRTIESFSVKHLNDMFYDTVLDVLDNKYDSNKSDMTRYNTSI